jgi:hypothetical protein
MPLFHIYLKNYLIFVLIYSVYGLIGVIIISGYFRIYSGTKGKGSLGRQACIID